MTEWTYTCWLCRSLLTCCLGGLKTLPRPYYVFEVIFGGIHWFNRLSNIFTKLVIDQRKKRPLKIITATVSNGDKRFCNSRDWSHKKTWSSLRASSGRSYASYVNAHESYVRELNRENICVVVRKRKSWAWFNLNVHARPSIHCLYLFTHVKSTLQWKSTPLYLACVEGVRKGRGRELVRSTTREGEGSFPFSLARSTCSRAPKSPLPLLTPATQATLYSPSRLLLLLARDFSRDIPIWRSCSQVSQAVTLVLSWLIGPN